MNDHSHISLADLPRSLSLVYRYLRPDAQSRRLRERVECGGANSKLDYESVALDFNRAFFVRNYLKCTAYLNFLDRRGFRSPAFAIDLGGGAGPFSLALHHSNSDARTAVVDHSYAQAKIGQTLSLALGLKHISMSQVADVFHTNFDDRYLRLASYWLCEHPNRDALSRLTRRRIFGNFSILIDYPDVIRSEAELATRHGGRATNLVSAKTTVCSTLAEMINQTSITFGGVCVEYPDQ